MTNAYISYIQEFQDKPNNVESFCTYANTTPLQFFQSYSSFEDLEKAIFRQFFYETLDVLHGDEVYSTYNTREKLLAFYYTWFQTLQPMRDFIVYLWAQEYSPLEGPHYYKDVRQPFINYVDTLLQNGIRLGEISERFGLEGINKLILWNQSKFLFQYWMTDTSTQFEQTDAAVEKSVNFAVDVMQPNLLDTAIDWFKFILQ